jgi:hypothetical protein
VVPASPSGHLLRTSGNLKTDKLLPLHRRSEKRDQIEVLMQLLMKPLDPYLHNDRHQRCPVHIDVGDTYKEIRRTWAEGRKQTLAFPVSRPWTLADEGRALLVPRLEKMDLESRSTSSTARFFLPGTPNMCSNPRSQDTN